MTRARTFGLGLFLLAPVLFIGGTPAAEARDVAFIEPGMGGGSGTPDEAFKIEPKSEIDIGDSIINIVRRETLFLVNQTAAPIKIEKISLSSDSAVAAVISNDDCSKQGTIAPLSRCSIELSITPTGPGAWSIEMLLTHNGPGRITRAKITGKTAGSDTGDKKDHGLFLSKNEIKPVDFGDVTIGQGKVVRSALMVNDSTSPITLFSIDVIEADKSLERLAQGCQPQMDLKPGESCPITLVWNPTTHGVISTDLIIRHSGPMGFAVIPVRGSAKGGETGAAGAGGSEAAAKASELPIPAGSAAPTVADIAKEAAKVALPVRGATLSENPAATGKTHLIGTVGTRAVFLKPDGSTVVAQPGEQIDLGGVETATVVNVAPKAATLLIAGKRKEYVLEPTSSLRSRAMMMQQASSEAADAASGNKSNAASSGSGGGGNVPGSAGGMANNPGNNLGALSSNVSGGSSAGSLAGGLR